MQAAKLMIWGEAGTDDSLTHLSPLLHHHRSVTIGQEYTLSNAAGRVNRNDSIIIHENDNDAIIEKNDFTPKKKEPSADSKTTNKSYTLG